MQPFARRVSRAAKTLGPQAQARMGLISLAALRAPRSLTSYPLSAGGGDRARARASRVHACLRHCTLPESRAARGAADRCLSARTRAGGAGGCAAEERATARARIYSLGPSARARVTPMQIARGRRRRGP